MKLRNPTPRAEMELFTSQLTVVVAPTAAVAWVPRLPTMAVSMYWTAVCKSCSSMVGQAKAMMVTIMALLILIPRCVINSPKKALLAERLGSYFFFSPMTKMATRELTSSR